MVSTRMDILISPLYSDKHLTWSNRFVSARRMSILLLTRSSSIIQPVCNMSLSHSVAHGPLCVHRATWIRSSIVMSCQSSIPTFSSSTLQLFVTTFIPSSLQLLLDAWSDFSLNGISPGQSAPWCGATLIYCSVLHVCVCVHVHIWIYIHVNSCLY